MVAGCRIGELVYGGRFIAVDGGHGLMVMIENRGLRGFVYLDLYRPSFSRAMLVNVTMGPKGIACIYLAGLLR